MQTKTDTSSARERILETAAELFFHQGYRATGINEVIARSEVAKATFYAHFPTKDDLCLAYLQDRNTSEYESIVAFVNDRKEPLDRFMAVIESIIPWLEANALRGCSFLNMVAEIPDPGHRLRQVGSRHYDLVDALIHDLTQELAASDPIRFGDLDIDAVTRHYMLILVGAIAMTEIYNDIRPARQAIEAVRDLVT